VYRFKLYHALALDHPDEPFRSSVQQFPRAERPEAV
jgi:hypothetical protein